MEVTSHLAPAPAALYHQVCAGKQKQVSNCYACRRGGRHAAAICSHTHNCYALSAKGGGGLTTKRSQQGLKWRPRVQKVDPSGEHTLSLDKSSYPIVVRVQRQAILHLPFAATLTHVIRYLQRQVWPP